MDITHAFDPSAPRLASAGARFCAQPPRLEALWARHADEVREAQRLRYRVFADEMGARLKPPPGTDPGLDVDKFDRHCEHLLVRCAETADEPARVVGTYRVLTGQAARQVGGFYTDDEFDLRRLDALRPQMAELGRSCTDASWRTGAVILLLWSSLAEFMHRHRLGLMIGCASVPMLDGGHAAASLWRTLSRTHLAPAMERVTPRRALPLDRLSGHLDVEPPPLIKGYLKCGATVLGPPSWDPDFGTADLPMMLRLAALPQSYRRRFLRH